MKFWELMVAIVAVTFPIYSGSAQTVQPVQPEFAYDNVDSPVDLLSSYYNAINLQEYQRAYDYWEAAPNSYNEFARGFAQTTHVQLIVQPPEMIGVGAGSQYVQIPTVVIAGQRDGSEQVYAGCFTTRKSNLQPPDVPEESLIWHLYSADNITEITGTVDIPTLLAEACAE